MSSIVSSFGWFLLFVPYIRLSQLGRQLLQTTKFLLCFTVGRRLISMNLCIVNRKQIGGPLLLSKTVSTELSQNVKVSVHV